MTRGSRYLVWSADVLEEVSRERGSQESKWGQQDHPDGTHHFLPFPDLPDEPLAREVEHWAKSRTNAAANRGDLTFEMILTEEWAEAVASARPSDLRAELIQVAAVAVAWVEAIDRRKS